MRRGAIILLGVLAAAAGAYGNLIFNDDFENKAYVESGNPDGWQIFGAPLDDRGTLHNGQNHSPTASVWVAFTWQSWGWGATTVSNEATRYDAYDNGTTLSLWMRANTDFGAGSIALTIYDADGTQLRTADADRFQPTTTWTEYQTTLSNMVVEASGSEAGLNHTNVVNFGFLAYTASQSGSNQIQFDDFQVNTIPEPATTGLVLGGLALLGRRLRRKHFLCG